MALDKPRHARNRVPSIGAISYPSAACCRSYVGKSIISVSTGHVGQTLTRLLLRDRVDVDASLRRHDGVLVQPVRLGVVDICFSRTSGRHKALS